MVLSSWPCKPVDFSSSSVRARCPASINTSLLTLQVWALNQMRRSQPMHMNRLGDLTPAPSMTIPMAHSSRPTLGFPLGTALLIFVIFSLSGIFSCCHHWDKLRAFLWSRHPDVILQEGQHTVISIALPSKTTSDHKNEKADKECGLPVIMPGDKIPKFFARPCPHEKCLPAGEENEAEVQVKCSVSQSS